ncbi:hypothetical protein FIBSPDRAFT_876215 [Athelia psychrophila]|uniref:Uncharacterized protein n=1 Tax=Athelia psychrophila TaxID=1759441 RepID=A0A167X351_9AGAM|nr:hypothetical protein FIBSPDRAFT_876215 [Fibularhizoctonia sp. CBS 109695]
MTAKSAKIFCVSFWFLHLVTRLSYAVLEASSAQIQQNKQLESKIQQRPSRTSDDLESVSKEE